MRVMVISGSTRTNSQSARISTLFTSILMSTACQEDIETSVMDLSTLNLPLWDEAIWNGDKDLLALWHPISFQLKSADAFVVIAPEWGGMAPAALKNLFLYCEDKELAHKPGLLVGISSGRGGSYPISDLRIGSYKNTHICWIPENVIIGQIKTFPSQLSDDPKFDRLKYGVNVLCAYGIALRQVRQSGLPDYTNFAYGM